MARWSASSPTGFVHLPSAFPRDVADAGRALLWAATGCDPDDPATWTRPVLRMPGFVDEPFRAAANTPRLLAAYDQLVGAGRWIPRAGLGTFPIRFPHPDDPGDDGWHVEASYPDSVMGGFRLNLRSRGRALLMLFLFSDVGPDDARPGSALGRTSTCHRCLPPPATTAWSSSRSPSKRSRGRRTGQ